MAAGLGLTGSASGADVAGGFAFDGKLDAPLRLFATQPDTGVQIYRERVQAPAGVHKSASTGRLSVLIRLADNVDEAAAMAALRNAGANVRSQLGPIVTADIPVVAVQSIAALDVVASIELARPLKSRLNVSVPGTGAGSLRTGIAPTWTGLTGKGVVVGIIDDGIDFRHPDFRNVDGSTRLLGLWDQRPSGAAGSPPAGFKYGGECTPEMINAAISGTAAACTQPSSGGHGTHVAGIAAGNGQATGLGQPGYRFIGMAPEADILSASGGEDSNASALDAIAWMKAKAEAAGKPLAINMSFGSYFGARDGTSNFEVGLSSAGGPGVVLVAAAGNEATDRLRAEGPLTQGGQLTFDVNVPAERRPGVPTSVVQLEAWYRGADSYSVIVEAPNCPASQRIGADAPVVALETACGLISVVNGGPFASNDDRQVQVIMRNGQSPLLPGIWRITFVGAQVTGGSATLSVVTGEDGNDMTIAAVNGVPPTGITTQILTDTSSAKRVIAVASYNTNYSWTTLPGTPSDAKPSAGPVGDLSDFSSRGPRRMCSNPVKCPQVMKPEITAPGALIMSALAVDKPVGPDDNAAREADGVHVALNGTSMATPHVTGAMALLLQRYPSLTPEDAKRALFSGVQKTSFTPAVPAYSGADVPPAPNYDWGYGVLDVAKAEAAAAVPLNYEGLWWNSPANSESGWGINFTHQGDTIFATWFTYGFDGKPLWLGAVANRTSPGVYAGDLFMTTGPAFNAVPWEPSKVADTTVGRATLTFADSTNATFAYTVNLPGAGPGAVVQTKTITRQEFGPPPTCIWGAQPDLATATNFQDLWWKSPANSESGWGINFTHQGDTIFATWFTYGFDGKPLWLGAVANRTSPGVYAGDLFTTTGPAFNAVPWEPSKVADTTVGRATLTFTDGNSATFDYTVNGASQTKPITRQVFAPPGTVCR
jgi:subtilisin family serine protease